MKFTIFTFLLFFIPFGFKAQSKTYYGELAGNDIKGTLTFNKDETVSGSYYYTSSPSRVYKITGTNFVQGEIEMNVYYAGRRVSSGTITKTLTESYVIWEGELWLEDSNGENRYFIFKRHL